MKKIELIALYRALDGLAALQGAKFAYGVSKNLHALKSDVDALQKAIDLPEDFKKFEEARIELVTKYSTLDEKGKPTIANNEYVLDPEQRVTFDKELKKLRKEHEVAIEAREKQVKEFNALLQEEITPNLYKIQKEDLPTNITAAQTYSIFPIIFDGV